MPTYHILKNLILTQEPRWMSLVKTVLGDDIHPQRAHDFALSRGALQLCLGKLGINLTIEELILEDYCTVKGQDSLTISLSHTSDWGAAVVAAKKEYVSVGIDIEPLTRGVKPAILERISHAADHDLPGLNLWSVKEASFKALMNTKNFPHPIEFSSIKISNNVWEHPESSTHGEWEVQEEQGLLVALAWIKI